MFLMVVESLWVHQEARGIRLDWLLEEELYRVNYIIGELYPN